MFFLSITEFIGHFHPLLVHLPIGILLLAIVLQWLSGKEKYAALRSAMPLILLCGIITAGASCISGYLLSLSDDYNKNLVSWHLWMALGVLLVSCLLYLKELNNRFAVNKKLLSAALCILIAVTGHLGGSLTHGSDYLSKPLKDIFIKDSTLNMTIRPLANVQEALVYNDVILPVLQTKCFTCHNAGKQKGGLQMDDINSLMKGGKNGKIIEPGNAAASEIIKRLLLPTDNDKHMPPKEKPQPTESQVALLHWWISKGADFTRKVKAMEQSDKIKPVLAALEQPPEPLKKERYDIPAEPVEQADEKVLSQLKTYGIIIIPVAQNSNYLTANFVTASIVKDTVWTLLARCKKQLVWLKLDNTDFKDSSAPYLSRLTALSRLSIANSQLTDVGIRQLVSLKNLQYLNLKGTRVTATGLLQLKALTKLKNIYLFGSGVKNSDYSNLKNTFPNVQIDTGGYRVGLLISDTTKVKASVK